ncbi:MAG: NADP-dependent malic enzyme [Deltaproteobacteria bacterium]|nr:MAG: NADP-dependent malic enzyme [Deltaproteobacteria bacterium]
MITKEEALEYHRSGRAGKIEVVATKRCDTQRDLSLAYTPGVAEPCREIVRRPDDAFLYTNRANLVAVVTNGTAVLGLGNIGPLAGKPVMEGKAVLFKRFAGVDVFDIELATEDPKEVIRVCKLLEPTFGGINLEDIRAPDCFEIEEALIEALDIPVFHDDQHGTAIISAAAFLNALELTNRRIEDVKVVFAGAGAAGIACADLYVKLGVLLENILMTDSRGVIYEGRKQGMNPYKARFARQTEARTLADALRGADAFVGVSAAGLVTKEMVRSMADQPLIFAMANPDPEITPQEVAEVRDDAIIATGRSDYPNQVNNVLGFPFIFRGALDVRARKINVEMKLAATRALADLAKQGAQGMPDEVIRAYEGERFEFGPRYIIPKPFDPRVLFWEASAVAEAAMRTGVARIDIDLGEYRERLERYLGGSREVMRSVMNKAKRESKRIVLPEGTEERVLRAVQILCEEGLAEPILLGDEDDVREKAEILGVDLKGVSVIDPKKSEKRIYYRKELANLRRRKGVTEGDAARLLQRRSYFGVMMVRMGDAHGLVAGLTKSYPESVRPALEIVGLAEGHRRAAGVYIIIQPKRVMFFADAALNIRPSAEDLADIAGLGAATAQWFGFEPAVAMLSFSNFGSAHSEHSNLVGDAVRIAQARWPDLQIDGEMQADIALEPSKRASRFPFSALKDEANVLIFPNLESGHIAVRLMGSAGEASVVGPILMGMRSPVNSLQPTASVEDIVNLTAITVLQAQKEY